jgi:hypothetical protein
MTLVLLFIGTIYGACCLIQMCHTSICISWLLIITHYSVLHVDGMPIARVQVWRGCLSRKRCTALKKDRLHNNSAAKVAII